MVRTLSKADVLPRNDGSHVDRINSSLNADHCFDDSKEEKISGVMFLFLFPCSALLPANALKVG